jgi:hypothetical protein
MFAVPVATSPTFRIAGAPRLLFKGDYLAGGRANYDVTADGKKFLMVEIPPVTELTVALNWIAELEDRVRQPK